VAVPPPDAQQPSRARHRVFHWEGVPVAFTKDPFMLHMDTPAARPGTNKVTASKKK